jgi:hypothetical protein
MPKYQDWSKRVVNGAQNWFVGEPVSPLIKAVEELKDDNRNLRGVMEELRREIATLKELPAKN